MASHIALVDDHPALMQGLARMLGQEPDLHVCGQFTTGVALLAYLEGAPVPPPDLLLLDLHLPPPLDGLGLLPRLRRQWPGLRVLVFSSAASPALVGQVATAGAHGFLDKAAEADDLLAAIRAVCAGQLVFPARPRPAHPPAVASPAAAAAEVLLQVARLSEREREVIGLVRQGLSTRAIAARLGIAELTVSTHRRNVLQKLGLHSPTELLRFAHEHGL